MASTKAKTAIVVGVTAILVSGTALIVIHHSVFSSTKELSSDVEAQYASWSGTTPEQVAKTLLQACGKEDWTEVAKYWQPGDPHPLGYKFKQDYAGLQVVSLGKPFWGWVGGKKYGGIFVPYELRLKNGELDKGRLAIRCDNPDKRWYLDGGM